MLTRITIDNYVLIDTLEIDFSKGLTIITGETGAGKSILLGALSLILGQRAESGVVKDPLRSCVVEASFDISDHQAIKQLLIQNELEAQSELIVRRIVTSAGKSRAFVGDTPVALPLLRLLGSHLIDIHAQHENLLLRQSDFQLELIDAFAGLGALRELYQTALRYYQSCETQYKAQKEVFSKGSEEQEYIRFQWEQLTAAKLRVGEQQELEEELTTLSHAREIREVLYAANQLLLEQEGAAIATIKEATLLLNKISTIYPSVKEIAQRLESARIEVKDLCAEMERKGAVIQDNPVRLEQVSQRLDTLYSLQQKHKRANVEELITYRETLASRFRGVEDALELLAIKEKELFQARQALETSANDLSAARKNALPLMEQKAVERLQQLCIPHAVLQLQLHDGSGFGTMGKDCPQFLFSANKDMAPGELSQIASGGELSRIMLCMKSLMVQSIGLPTIIFDEIDLGVSGRIADKMGDILHEMSARMQVVAITHLPQIASKGSSHLMVYKVHDQHGSTTHLKALSSNERVMEIARLLSGSNVSEAAINNAKQLLNIL
ncbi:MAG: DNA repair protein RecN [Prevotellaceae bacterium]|jgi:DNA repair protein RecN (Recombination protein N)|nr:DNA repair protein RecN [Prevotellaceae bacterium]